MKTIPLFLAAAVAACGQATYTYTGNNFNAVAYWPVSFAATGTHVTAVITLPFALPKGVTTCLVSRAQACANPAVNLNGFSWDISDGVNTIAGTYPNNATGSILNILTFTTDANGDVVNWDMDASNGLYSILGAHAMQTLEISTANEPAPGFENQSDLSSVNPYLASISGNPGTWAVKDPVAPVVVGGTGYGSIAAGGLGTVYGNFSGFPVQAGQGTSLGGVQVLFPGTIEGGAPLFYVSPTQITFQVPWELQQASSKSTPLTITWNGQSVASVLLSALPAAAPGVFELNAQHQAAALDASSQPVGPGNPAHAGSAISIYCTGLGAVNVAQADGVAAPLDRLIYTNSQPTVTIGGVAAQVLFSGLAPGTAGLFQIDVTVPNVPAGTQLLTVTISNVASNTTTLEVR